nr:Chain C, NEUROTENSIN/NEUROMEDIN N [Rattus norvegicus]4BUO_D Chain D, NEUROTENSIN/NEUROMEDIN N [Rattus norvegicus]4BV0_C Chain C, NEUROTENSIN/NEUROMEDIN N [Rattus norvegicus]4BV0_D Chain D, NEUROTENSIN/NEUROMEDIN N [Rattus norvegicus]4BWB_C Chain C, NEUROTENSIN [Rattus norvegicus]4BWB_D Chain D, NEUROTENSIN [Rattus norvegicus]7L0P_D Chain D, Neurotensin [Rattus norvegicus]7L0Q_D Chain D, Neurotensin [Rattus norvegicus]7L0R_D Chain D, Neurotensin [Rattus norvegicus]7L0S_D Chain D, Neurote
GPGGRRPYIL